MRQKIAEKNRLAGEDDTLIDAFLSGEKAAFDGLVLRYQDKIFSLCYWFLGDYQEAKDIAQDIFLKVYTSLGKFRRDASFSTWLHRIAVNSCKNKQKSFAFRFRKKTASIDETAGEQWMVSEAASAFHTDSPAQALERKEKTRLIQKGIQGLSPAKRAVVVLRDLEGFSYEEISAVTGLKLGTVKSKLARARADLVNKLKDIL